MRDLHRGAGLEARGRLRRQRCAPRLADIIVRPAKGRDGAIALIVTLHPRHAQLHPIAQRMVGQVSVFTVS